MVTMAIFFIMCELSGWSLVPCKSGLLPRIDQLNMAEIRCLNQVVLLSFNMTEVNSYFFNNLKRVVI